MKHNNYKYYFLNNKKLILYLLIISLIIVTFVVIYILLNSITINYNQSDENNIKEITIGTFSKSMGNSPYYIAKNFGYFENEPDLKGIKINYVEYNDRSSISDAFAKGDLQVYFLPRFLQCLLMRKETK